VRFNVARKCWSDTGHDSSLLSKFYSVHGPIHYGMGDSEAFTPSAVTSWRNPINAGDRACMRKQSDRYVRSCIAIRENIVEIFRDRLKKLRFLLDTPLSTTLNDKHQERPPSTELASTRINPARKAYVLLKGSSSSLNMDK